MKRSVAFQAGAIVAASVVVTEVAAWAVVRWAVIPAELLEPISMGALVVALPAALTVALITRAFFSARLKYLVEVLDATGPNVDLARIRNLGDDEVAAIGHAVNRLLARMTRIRASMIDQERVLERAQQELALKASLSEKTEELAQRLEERQMLFDILRMTTSSQEIDQVLHTLVERVGQLLRFREVVIFIHDEPSQTFIVRAAYGFASEEALIGKSVAVGEGVSGRVGKTREPLLIQDVSREEGYLGFWGQAERKGSLAAVPIVQKEQLMGVLTVTRAESNPVTDVHLNLLGAIADNAALAIGNAQLFTRMRELSTQDELTGLANRRLFRSQLSMEIDRSRRFEQPLSVVAIDIDHFKQLNDRHGHPVGDTALREVSTLLARSVRKVDTVARVGGEEFMLVLPRADLTEAERVASKLRQAVLAFAFTGGSEQPGGKLTVSIGVSELTPTDDDRGQALIERADQALYAAKNAGRNRVFAVQGPRAVSSLRPVS